MRAEIADTLGESPGSNRTTFNFAEQNTDIDLFLMYLTEMCRKEDGGLYKALSYTGQCTSLVFFQPQYNQTQPPIFQVALTEAMTGAKNLCKQAQQHGEGNIEDGNCPLTWALYSNSMCTSLKAPRRECLGKLFPLSA